MKNIEEQLNILKKITLNTEEKNAMRDFMVSYIKDNPVRNTGDSRLRYRASNVINKSLITKQRMTIAIIIALLLGGGTSFAAENSLPGDILYPVKIHVNENVEELVAVSDTSEAKLQAKLAGRRLEEAEKLAVEGKLSAETSTELKAGFEDHSQKSKEHIAKIKEAGDMDASEEASSDLEVALGMHENVLSNIKDSRSDMKDFISGILDSVRLHSKEVSDDRISMESKMFAEGDVKTKVAAEGALTASQNKIDEVKKFIDDRKSGVSADVQAGANARLNAANGAMAEGKAKIEAQAYADAFALFKKASREAQEAKLFITTMGDMKIELKNDDRIEIKNENHGEGSAPEQENAGTTTQSNNNSEDAHEKTEVKIDTEGSIDTKAGSNSVSGNGETKIKIGL